MRISLIESQISKSFETKSKVLTLGKSYIVYALTIDAEGTWFCILDEARSSPMWHPEYCFKIEHQRLSRYWIINSWKDKQGVNRPILAFPEWANSQYFHWDLVESDEEAWKIFRKYEKLMNLEFPNPTIKETAQIGDDKWLICPLCIDAWENQVQDALIICPKCQTVLNNPRYKDEIS